MRKLRTLEGPASKKAKVFFSGLQFVATCRGEVSGCAPRKIAHLRQSAAEALGIPRSGSRDFGF
eukprot:2626922-Pyramimonas_sp.AAC.1